MSMQMEEIKARGIAKGIAEGRAEKAKEIVLNLIAMQKDMSDEQLAAIAGVSVEQIKEWIEEKKSALIYSKQISSDTFFTLVRHSCCLFQKQNDQDAS